MVKAWLNRNGLLLLALINMVLVWCVGYFVVQQDTDDKALKVRAVDYALQARDIIGLQIVGEEYTPLTTTLAPVQAKKLSLQADFAAVAVELLKQSGVKEGSVVAVNMSGSFPALNIAVLSAVKALNATPVITSSVGASTWGANRAGYTWLDMEHDLAKAGVWAWRSNAAAVGGNSDRGDGLSEEGIQMAKAAIQRNGIKIIESKDLNDGVLRRLEIYESIEGTLPVALINVGGSHVVFGQQGHRNHLHQGLLAGYRAAASADNGLAAAFLQANRPVIHVLNIARLAAKYNIVLGAGAGNSSVFYTQYLPKAVRVAMIGWLVGMFGLLCYGKRQGWWQRRKA